jgi:predicted RNase H-like HicB family nuclease
MMRYPIIIEKTNTGYSAYSPDLSGCVATGTTKAEVTQNMHEAIAFHLEGLRLEGLEIPQPRVPRKTKKGGHRLLRFRKINQCLKADKQGRIE